MSQKREVNHTSESAIWKFGEELNSFIITFMILLCIN